MVVYNDLQLIKREFFAMRNGIIADTLRRAGSPFRIIFGLTIPQIVDIARAVGFNRNMAELLWQNSTTRESMMLATLIFPPEEMTYQLALQWISESQTPEIIDTLCHRLLRKLNFAWQLVDTLANDNDDLKRYAAIRLTLNLLPSRLDDAARIADTEIQRNCLLTRGVASQLKNQIEDFSL